MSEEKLKLKKKIKKGPTLVVALHSPGLVGNLAGLTLSLNPEFEHVGSFKGSKIPPIASIHKGKVYSPIRVYYHPKKNILLFLSEVSIPANASYEVGKAVLELVDKYDVKDVYILSSMNEPDFHYITNKKGVKLKLYEINEGALAGLAALILSELSDRGIEYLALFAPVEDPQLDIKNTIKLLKKVEKLLGIKVDYRTLKKHLKEEEAEEPVEEQPKGMYR
ncbi:MAG: hypothetical protein GXN92_01420 [Candidatus Micrarchaeota archaeon]|nr:hypothetical protein [Candidatus Micrarchaeota archaeon]